MRKRRRPPKLKAVPPLGAAAVPLLASLAQLLHYWFPQIPPAEDPVKHPKSHAEVVE